MKSDKGDRALRAKDGVRDVEFDAAGDVQSIAVRLHPIDVGFELKRSGRAIVIRDEAMLRVSYAAANGDRRVMEGSRDAVVGRLRKLGYEIRIEEG